MVTFGAAWYSDLWLDCVRSPNMSLTRRALRREERVATTPDLLVGPKAPAARTERIIKVVQGFRVFRVLGFRGFGV